MAKAQSQIERQESRRGGRTDKKNGLGVRSIRKERREPHREERLPEETWQRGKSQRVGGETSEVKEKGNMAVGRESRRGRKHEKRVLGQGADVNQEII